MKGEKIGYSKSASSVAVMKDLKHLFDPDNLFNPYKVSAPLNVQMHCYWQPLILTKIIANLTVFAFEVDVLWPTCL